MLTQVPEPQEHEGFSGTVSFSLPPRERQLELLRTEQWSCRMWWSGSEGRVSVAAGSSLPHDSFWGIVPPIKGWTAGVGCLPWPLPSGIFKLHPEKQVRHWNASVASGAQELRTGFENKMSPWVASGRFECFNKNLFYLPNSPCHREEGGFKYLLLCCCCGFTCVISPCAWLEPELLTWTWHRDTTAGKSQPAKCCFPSPILVTVTPLVLY